MTRKQLKKRLAAIARETRKLRDEREAIEGLLARQPVKEAARCRPSWQHAADICRSIRTKHRGRLTYQDIHAIAQREGLTVPARWQTLERQSQAYWRWRNSPTHSLAPKP